MAKDKETCKVRYFGEGRNRERVYLCEQRLDLGYGKPMELTVAKTYPHKSFIIESGAGISKKRRENQVIGYLKKLKLRKGYISASSG